MFMFLLYVWQFTKDLKIHVKTIDSIHVKTIASTITIGSFGSKLYRICDE